MLRIFTPEFPLRKNKDFFQRMFTHEKFVKNINP